MAEERVPTRTQRLYFAQDKIWREQQAALEKCAAEEFPVGCKVKWVYTFKRPKGSPLGTEPVAVWWRGTVVDQGWRYDVRHAKTGTVHRVEVRDLYLDSSDGDSRG